MKTVFGVIAGIIVLYALSFVMCGAVFYGICWAFGLTFSWKIVFGIWLILIILRGIFGNSSSS